MLQQDHDATLSEGAWECSARTLQSCLGMVAHRVESDDEKAPDWEEVSARVRFHPEEAAEVCEATGRTMLQCAFWKYPPAPVHIVRALFEAHRAAVLDVSVIWSAIYKYNQVDPNFVCDLFEANHDAAFNTKVIEAAVRSSSNARLVWVLLERNPGAASTRLAYPPFPGGKEDRFDYPIHLVREADTARMLLRSWPGAICARNSCGQLPIHRVACNSNNATLLSLLIEEGIKHQLGSPEEVGGLLSSNAAGISPFDFVLRRTVSLIRHLWNGKEVTAHDQHLLDLDWELLIVMVRAIVWHHPSLQGQRTKISIANHALSHGHPVLLLCVVAKVLPSAFQWTYYPGLMSYALDNSPPEEAGRRNEYGALPIHVAVACKAPLCVISALLSVYPAGATSHDANGQTPLAIAAKMRTAHQPGLIHTLLQHGAHAAETVDGDGRLPLTLVADSGWNFHDGVEAILRAAPRALWVRDKCSGLFPFQTAAVGKCSALDTVYCLLREKPDVIALFDATGRGKKRKHTDK